METTKIGRVVKLEEVAEIMSIETLKGFDDSFLSWQLQHK